MQAYFGRAKAGCLCSYCCNRHLRVSTCAFVSKTFTRLKKPPALQAIQSDALNTELLEAQVTRKGHLWAKTQILQCAASHYYVNEHKHLTASNRHKLYCLNRDWYSVKKNSKKLKKILATRWNYQWRGQQAAILNLENVVTTIMEILCNIFYWNLITI